MASVDFLRSLPSEDSGGQLVKATIAPLGTYIGKKGEGKDASEMDPITVLFNPKEYSIEKSVNWQSKGTVGKDGEHLEYTGAENETLALELFCDTTRQDIDVRAFTDQVRVLTMIDEELGHPRLVEFRWGTFIFRGVITRLSQKFTHFNRSGTPVRASLNITFKESRPLWMDELDRRRRDYDDIDIVYYDSDVMDDIGDFEGVGGDWGEGLPGRPNGGADVDFTPTPRNPPGGGGGQPGGPGGPGGNGGPGGGPGGIWGEGPGGGGGGGGNPHIPPGNLPPGGGLPGGPGGGVNPGDHFGGNDGPAANPRPKLKLIPEDNDCTIGDTISIKVEFENLDKVVFDLKPAELFEVDKPEITAPTTIKVKGLKDGRSRIRAQGYQGDKRKAKDQANVACKGGRLELTGFGYLPGQ